MTTKTYILHFRNYPHKSQPIFYPTSKKTNINLKSKPMFMNFSLKKKERLQTELLDPTSKPTNTCILHSRKYTHKSQLTM